jgi:iron complex outermembrane receptor protein
MKKLTTKYLLSTATMMASLLASVAVCADEAEQLETVVVEGTRIQDGYSASNASTGTKTDTPLMETPLAITVIPQQVLQDQKADTLTDVLKNVSGVRSKSMSTATENIYLRGFATTTTFRDGFRMDGGNGNGLRSLANVDSVEVLKGPAAILYGRVEPGGIVNLVTKKPQETPYYSIEQQVGSWDHYVTSVDATGPINENKSVLYRLNASYETADSWRDKVHDERQFIAPVIQWKLSPQTQIGLEAEYNHNPFTYDSAQAVPYDEATGQIVWLPRKHNLAYSPTIIDTTLLALNWSHQFNDDWSIKHQIIQNKVNATQHGIYYLVGFTQVGATWTADRQRQDLPYSRVNTDATILDVTGHFDTAGLKHTLLLGMDYYRYRDPVMALNSSTFSTTDAFNPAPATGLVIDPTMFWKSESTTRNTGVYVQDQIKLTHEIQMLAGLRYQKVSRVGQSLNGAGFGGTGEWVADDDQSDSDITPRVGVLWQAQNWLSLYGNYAENFGANTGRDWQLKPLDPENAKQYEVGAKSEFFGGKLTSSLALYDLTKNNVAVNDLLHPGFSVTVGEINSRGLEFDIQGEVAPGWDVIASYTHDTVVVAKSTPESYYVEDNRMPGVPKNMTSLSSTYKLKQKALQGWKVGGGVTWTDSTLDYANTTTTPAYAVFDAMAAYEFKVGKHTSTLQLNIDNLFNKTYYSNLDISGNAAYLTYGEPRSATASVKVEF